MTASITDSNLTTKTKVKLLLGITASTNDDLIDMLILNTTRFIEGYCGGRQFLNQNYVEVYDSAPNRGTKGGSVLFLNQFPITAVTYLKYRAGTVDNPNWVTYNTNSYLNYLKEGFIRFYGVLPEISQALQVTYTAGYLIDFAHETDLTKHNLPWDLCMVATEIVARKMQFRQAQGMKSMSVEGESVTFGEDTATKDQLAILKKYKTTRMAI